MDKNNEDLMALREILARELETINHYQRLLGRAQSPQVAGFISHVIDEEKEHVAEAMGLITQFDQRQAELFQSGHRWQVNQSQRAGDTDDARQSDAPSTKQAGVFTVGSLRGAKDR